MSSFGLRALLQPTGHDFLGETAHLRFERLELEHEKLDSRSMESTYALGHCVVATDEARRGAAIAADARGSGHVLNHHNLGIDIGLLLHPQGWVFFGQSQKMGIGGRGLRLRLTCYDEGTTTDCGCILRGRPHPFKTRHLAGADLAPGNGTNLKPALSVQVKLAARER